VPTDPDRGLPALEFVDLVDDDDSDDTVNRASATALGLVALVAGAAGGYVVGSRHSDTTTVAKAPVKLSTAKVQQLDLVTYDDTTATLGFTTSSTVSSPIAGTVTSVVNSGDTVDAGTVVATVDGAPVVAMIGDIPGYRDLSTASSNGADVRQLEMNLVQLGFDPNHKIVIDEKYDAATKAAVTAWENSLGLTGDGKITKGEIVFIPGKLLVDTVSATVGGSVNAGSPLVVGRQAERKYLVSGLAGATIDHQAAAGTNVGTGTVLYWSNGLPVIAIEGDAAATPVLSRSLSVGVTDGADVKLFEQALTALGFNGDGAMTVDDHFDGATATAAAAWLASLGVTADPASVAIPAGAFVVVPSGLSVGAALVPDGTVLAGDSVVQSLTAPSRQVTTTAPVSDDTFALGAKIDVEFPDGTVQPGTVVDVGNVATNTTNTPGATPSVTITIGVDNIPSSVDSFVEIPVTLRVVSASVPNAIVVPVSALLALKEGGYAVQEVTGKAADGTDQTKLVGVTPGLFSNGFVQVQGNLTANTDVVVPS
jgi:peptidoglycan hydrolase-like protein with peptidoglycan-binding domain